MSGKFGGIEGLKRDRKIEGETGIDLRIEGTKIVLTILAATNANPKWRELSTKAVKEINRQEKADASPQEIQALWAALFAKAIVIGWKGVVDENGNEVGFTIETCTQFLTEADDAYEAIQRECANTQNFRVARVGAIVGDVKN